jgi:hypothetical protein
MTDNNMTGFKTEGQPAFPVADAANDNAAGSSPGKTDTTQTQSQSGEQGSASNNNAAGGEAVAGKTDGKPDDFAKHPRWQEREADWGKRFNDQEKRHTDEVAKIRTELETKLAAGSDKKDGQPDPGDVPPWFNGDEKQWSEFQAWNRGLIKSEAEAIAEGKVKGISAAKEAEEKAIKDATDYFQSEVTAIEADKTMNPKGDKVDRNRLLKTAQDFDLVTSDGKWNYRAAFRIMQNQFTPQTKDNKERKELAGATVSGGKTDTKQETVSTSEDFSGPNRPW